ncbi:hypothetical protein ELUMI_v1c08750 [Williamsoniiplasma luminosum]|uniref:Uncharacterized protein n=1 Tax=Williamsoniiplasma luminosum TaxID=214888 RepID=A0A2K8NVM3_9MOLU|nr:hypothetical protein [Williamsoniiplasma luminosum]ATZ17596.1 hypothetical protein ELUMI_v1c08750 [Williamsoniiplasma luminosum]
MKNLIKIQTLSNSEQYLILEWLAVAFFQTQVQEIVLETESLSV